MALIRDTLKTEVDTLFSEINTIARGAQALGSSLPIVGDKLSGAPAFFADIQTQIDAVIAQISDLPSAQDILDKFNQLTNGIVTATLDPNNSDLIILEFKTVDTIHAAPPAAAINAGGSVLGLTLNADLATDIKAAIDIKAAFDITTQTFTFVNNATTKELTLGLASSFNLSGTGTLGFLNVTATDILTAAPELNLNLGIDMTSFTDATFSVSGNADLGLHLKTAIDPKLPSFETDLGLHWSFNGATAADPSFTMTNVQVDLGTLLKTLTGIFQPVTDLFNTKPLGDIIKALTTPIPIVSDAQNFIKQFLPGGTGLDLVPNGGDGIVTFLDLAALWFKGNSDNAKVEQLQTFGKALGLLKVVASLNDVNAGLISLGDINFDPAVNATSANFDPQQALLDKAQQLLGQIPELAQAVTTIKGLVNGTTNVGAGLFDPNHKEGVSIPLLEDPSLVMHILLPELFKGQPPVDLVKFTLPTFSAQAQVGDFPIIQFGPVGITFGGKIDAGFQLTLAYDTTGLLPGKSLQDGIVLTTGPVADFNNDGILGNDLNFRPGSFLAFHDPATHSHLNYPVAFVTADIGLFGGVSVPGFKAGVRGSLVGEADAFFPGTGLRLADLAKGCIFDPLEGALGIKAGIELKVGFGPFAISKNITLAEITLVEFQLKCAGGSHAVAMDPGFGLATPSPDPNHATGGPDLILNVGDRANQRSIDNVRGTDVAEVIYIHNGVKSDALGAADIAIPDTLQIEGFGISEDYGSAGRPITGTIRGNFGANDDTLVISKDVNQRAEVHGGAGNDLLVTGAGHDILFGDDGSDQLSGGAGNDAIYGGSGDDTIDGGLGADSIDGGDGVDQVSYEKSSAGVNFTPVVFNTGIGSVRAFVGRGGDAEGDVLSHIESFIGSHFNDTIYANPDLDTGTTADNPVNVSSLEGLEGNDILIGGHRRDFIIGGAGADYISGVNALVGVSEEEDGTSYYSSQGAVQIDLAAGTATGGDAQGDVLISIEDVQGSGYDDLLLGNSKRNVLDGGFGNDIVDGRGGLDELSGGEGDDIVYVYGQGAVLDGGGGVHDLLSYERVGGGVGVSANLELGTASLILGPNNVVFDRINKEGNGVYSTFEDLNGTNGGDELTGDGWGNIIRGLNGNDLIYSAGGNDTLIGGAGADFLNGGAGIDLADFSESSAAVFVDLFDGVGAGGDAEGDTFFQTTPGLSSVENLRGTAFADTLIGDEGDNEINPGLSATPGSGLVDAVDGLGTNDIDTLVADYSLGDLGKGLVGGFDAGATSVDWQKSGSLIRELKNSGAVLDGVVFQNMERLVVTGTIKSDVIFGGLFNDRIATGAGADTVYTGLGFDNVWTGAGRDFVASGTGADRQLSILGGSTPFSLDGGSGIDTLSISLAAQTRGITLIGRGDLRDFRGTNLSLSDGTGISNFEILKDVWTGSGKDYVQQEGSVDNIFKTGGDVDVIKPGLGNNDVNGGFDYTIGNTLAEELTDLGSPDHLSFAINNEAAFKANLGDQLFLDYSTVAGPDGVTSTVERTIPGYRITDALENQFNYSSNRGTYTTASNGVTNFSEIERLYVTGSNQGDVLTGTYNFETPERFFFTDGGPPPRVTSAMRGRDFLYGGAGNDKLIGNTGNDTLAGGDGNDILIGSSLDDFNVHVGSLSGSTDPNQIDTLYGGAGADTFVLASRGGDFGDVLGFMYGSIAHTGGEDPLNNRAVIMDFNATEGDALLLSGDASFYKTTLSADGTTTYLLHVDPLIDGAARGELIAELKGVTSLDLDAAYVHYDAGGTFPVSANLPAPLVAPVFAPLNALQIAPAAFAGPQVPTLVAPVNSGLVPGPITLQPFTIPAGTQAGTGLTLSGLTQPSPIGQALIDQIVPATWVTQENDPQALLAKLFRGNAGSDGIDHTKDRVELVGDGVAFGTFDSDPFGLGSGIVLSTGDVRDLAGTNTEDGGIFSPQNTNIRFEKIGRIGLNDIFRADLSNLGFNLNSLTLNDSGSRIGGGTGYFSGFDIDAIALSTKFLPDLTGITDLNDPSALPRLDVLDFSSAGMVFRPGTQRASNGVNDFPITRDLVGEVNGIVDNSAVILDQFDQGAITLGDGGSLSLNLKQTVKSGGPLYLYVAEAGASGETLETALNASSSRIEAPADLSTDLGQKGVADDKVTFTYHFTPDAILGANSVAFQFALFSEELTEWAGSAFNDTFSIKLNGVELAQLSDGSALTTNNLLSTPFGKASSDFIYNPSVNNPFGAGAHANDTRADAYTKVLTFAGALIKGDNELKIEVADVRDGFLDSGILVKAGTFHAGLNLGGFNTGGVGGTLGPGSTGLLKTPGISIGSTGPDGTPLKLEEGRPAKTLQVTITPPDGGLTSPVDVTLTPDGNVDLGAGTGKPIVVRFVPGGTTTFDVPISGTPDGVQQGNHFVPISISSHSDDLNFNHLPIAPVIVQVCDPIAPTAIADVYSLNEDVPLIVDIASGVLANDTDPQNDPLTATLVSGPSHGTLSFNADGSFTYTPATDFFGQDSFIYHANDGLQDSGPATVTLNVAPVNDAPRGTPSAVLQHGLEDHDFVVTKQQLLQGLSDPENDPLSVSRLSVSNGTAVANADGSYSITPALDYNGPLTISYDVSDGPGATLAGLTLSTVIDSVNDAPGGKDKTITILEDNSYKFTVSDFGFSDTRDAPANALKAVKISELPANGKLLLGATAVIAGQFVSAADIAAGNLKFVPVQDKNGTAYAKIGFQVQDDGGTANGGVDLDPFADHIVINVTPVNDAPVIASGGGGDCARYVLEEGGKFVTKIAAADPDAGSSLTYGFWTKNKFVATDDKFTIDAKTGIVSLKRGADDCHEYSVTVAVKDQTGLIDKQAIKVVAYDDNHMLGDPAIADTFVFTKNMHRADVSKADLDHDFFYFDKTMHLDASALNPANGHIHQVGGNVVFTMASTFDPKHFYETDSVTIKNTTIAQLTAHADHFLFG